MEEKSMLAELVRWFNGDEFDENCWFCEGKKCLWCRKVLVLNCKLGNIISRRKDEGRINEGGFFVIFD